MSFVCVVLIHTCHLNMHMQNTNNVTSLVTYVLHQDEQFCLGFELLNCSQIHLYSLQVCCFLEKDYNIQTDSQGCSSPHLDHKFHR